MTAVKLLKLDSFHPTDCQLPEHSGRPSLRPAQHGQPGPTPPASPANADQDSSQPLPPGANHADHSPADQIRLVRRKQQVDLAMLRLSFRKLILPEDQQDRFDEKHTANPVRNFSCSEFSNLVSAVTRFHSDERETFGVKPPDPNQQNDQSELQKLEALTLAELYNLCRQEGIRPPDSCQTPTEESPLP